jgi:hypothetical protein
MSPQDDPITATLQADQEELHHSQRDHENVRQSSEYQKSLAYLRRTIEGLHKTFQICEFAATRWPVYAERYLFPRHKDDIGEAAVAAQLAIENGALNSARRELRYMLEVAVNTAFVDEVASDGDVEARLAFFKGKGVKKQNVDHIRDLPLRMLADKREKFVDVTRLAWVNSSNYVHLTKRRIDEKVKLRAEGIRLGFETAQMLAAVVQEVHDACSIVVVLAFETIGPNFTGDILVTGGLDNNDAWPFQNNEFIAAIDSYFDYKHERQAGLEKYVTRRERRVSIGPYQLSDT